MGFFRQLEIQLEEDKKSFRRAEFRASSYHVAEIFLYFLPRKLNIDGSSKFILTLCPGQCDVQTRNFLGVTEYKISNFDYLNYYSTGRAEQGNYILALICSAFSSHIAMDSPAMSAIEFACKKVAEANFKVRYEVEKLRRSLRASKIKVRVYRTIGGEVGESWDTEVERDGDIVALVPMRTGTLTDLTGYYVRSEIESDVYVVHGSLGKVAFSVGLKEYFND